MKVQVSSSIALLCSVINASVLKRADNATVQGFSRAGLLAMNADIHKWVDDKNGPNVVTLVARNGEIINHDAYGVLDVSASNKMAVKKDTIFRIMSMTKPVVGIGMMMMYEAGKWKLDDLVSKHIPEFANLQVKDANNNTVPQKTPMTMAQLVSHSAGFGAMLTVMVPTLGEIIPPLVEGQLAFQPGRDWRYGPGVEIQGYLIEKWAGKDLSDFFKERIFDPLGLVDTGFFIDPSKVSRVSQLHNITNGVLQTQEWKAGPATSKPKRLSPSGGLYSTAEEYWKISQMVLDGGVFKGTRYLKEDSVKMMHTNYLQPDVGVRLANSTGVGIGFGVDYAIILDPIASKNNQPKDAYYWGGAYGTFFWNDPVNKVVCVGMIQMARPEESGPTALRQIAAKALYAAQQK